MDPGWRGDAGADSGELDSIIATPGRFEMIARILRRRWLVAALSVAIALISAIFLYLSLNVAYEDYWLDPMAKAPEYVYPELRYAFFNIVMFMWALDGLVAAGVSLRDITSGRAVGTRARQLIALYFILLLVLILGGCVMIYVRSKGY